MASRDTNLYVGTADLTIPEDSDLVTNWNDELVQAKTQSQNSFPNVTGAVTATHTELNYVDGVTSAIQTQIDAKASATGGTLTGDYTFSGNLYSTGGKVGFGVTTPYGNENGSLHIRTGAYGGVDPARTGIDDLIVEGDAAIGINLLCPSANTGTIAFGDPSDANVGFITYSHADDDMAFQVNAAERLTIDSDGTLRVNTASYEALVTDDDDIPNKAYVDARSPWKYVSTNRNIALGTNQLSLNHSLGAVPTKLGLHIVCTSADLNYAVGDVVELPTNMAGGSNGLTMFADATQVHLTYDSTAIIINNKNTPFARSAVNRSNWDFVLKASV